MKENDLETEVKNGSASKVKVIPFFTSVSKSFSFIYFIKKDGN